MNPHRDGDGPNRTQLIYASQKSTINQNEGVERIQSALRMRALLASTLGVIALGAPLVTTIDAAAGPFAKRTSLKAVIFEDVKPLYQKSGDTYEGFGVDILNLIKDQAGRRTLTLMPATSTQDGIKAITSGKADIACGVAFDWGRAEQVSYTIPFAIGGTRLLTKTSINGTPASLSGKTVGVVKDSSSAKILGAVVPSASLQSYATPAEAFDAYNSGKISTLAGGTLWLAANSDAKNSELVPVRPYGRTGIGCIVKQNNGKLLAAANNAIGQTMQEYVNGNAATRVMVNRWIGPSSSVMIPEKVISDLYSLLLSTTSEMSVSPN